LTPVFLATPPIISPTPKTITARPERAITRQVVTSVLVRHFQVTTWRRSDETAGA